MSVETITTVLVAAQSSAAPNGSGVPAPSPYDLVSLATAKDELSVAVGDASNDAFIQRAVTQTSSAIAKYCNRVFAVESLQDQIYIQQDPYPYQVPGGVYALQLTRWPLANSAVVNFTGTTNGSKVITGIPSTAGIVEGTLVFASDGSIPAGTTVDEVYPKSLILTQAATSRTVGLALNTGLQVIQTLSVGDTQSLVYGTDYTVDAARGWLIRLNGWTASSSKWEARPTTVQYQAGYSAIPDDLQDACLRLVTSRFRARGRDPMLVERVQGATLGSERYWVGNTPGQTGSLSPEIEALVDSYRVPVCG
jgi:hypothetical protein